MRLTPNTDRTEYADYLDTKRHNAAIAAHADKVRGMSEEEWVEHRANLIRRRSDPKRRATVERIVNQILEKSR